MALIEIKNLTKRFEKLIAVDDLSLEINEGEIFGLLGPNGAGKTTTLSMLATLLAPTDGTAIVNGFDIKGSPSKVRSSIGFVFQDPSSDDLLTGRENLYLHALMYGVQKKDLDRKIDDALRLVNLTDRQHERMRKYSGGMRRRLELARGLLHEPKILFLDEPTLGLDPQTRENLWSYIKKLANEKKITIIITTHYMEEADQLCNRIAIIDHGKIVALDTPANLKKGIGGDVVTLKTEKPNLDVLKHLKYIKKSSYEKGILSLTVDNAGLHLQEILKKIGDVESVESRSPTLHDVFLHLTGKEIRGEEAEGGFFQRMINSRRR